MTTEAFSELSSPLQAPAERVHPSMGNVPEVAASAYETFITRKKARELSDELRTGNPDLWLATPNYTNYDELGMYRKYHDIARGLRGHFPDAEIDRALEVTEDFLQRSFALYMGNEEPEYPANFVFAVPTRTQRGVEEYSSEVTKFLPLLDEKYVDSEVRQRAIVGLPPSVIESYNVQTGEQGQVVFTPIYADMAVDLGEKAPQVVSDIINDTARFAHARLGARVMGLGAILPALTFYGRRIEQEGLVTTTGHGGTVHLIVETARDMMEHTSRDETIGIIGAAGSIGSSSLEYMSEEFSDKKFVLCDKPERTARLQKMAAEAAAQGRNVNVAENAIEVLRRSDVIVSAITERINLDLVAPDLDLTGKIIVDDSQPGCFDRTQVEARGGKLVWVVGHDNSEKQLLTRVGGYAFGRESGLALPGDVWGCEAEAASIATTGRYDLALRSRVRPESARAIGDLLREVGVGTAQPQSFGTRVQL